MTAQKMCALLGLCAFVAMAAPAAHAAEHKVIAPAKAAKAIGPYSHGVAVNGLVFTSGQLPIDPATNTMPEGIEAQTKQSLENVRTVLEAAGSSMDKVVKVTVFMKDLNDFAKMNEVYATFFTGNYPVRTTVQAARIPKDALIEIDVTAAQ